MSMYKIKSNTKDLVKIHLYVPNYISHFGDLVPAPIQEFTKLSYTVEASNYLSGPLNLDGLCANMYFKRKQDLKEIIDNFSKINGDNYYVQELLLFYTKIFNGFNKYSCPIKIFTSMKYKRSKFFQRRYIRPTVSVDL